MQSLLGQFYNRIKGSQEDIASESLTYILKKSLRARQTINQIINLNTGLIFSDLSYKTQNIGENLERPDISGINENGKEVLIIEAKFWSSLTNNQPNEYLNRLEANTTLLFVVPKLRIRAIYEEVLQKVKQNFSNFETDSTNQTITLNQISKHILIKSWSEILIAIKSELTQEDNQTLISDINQIIGFCDTIDRNSFQPITDTDLSPSIPRKIISYYDIVDKVVDEIKNRTEKASTKGLNKTRQKFGYRRYFSLGNFGLGIGLEMDLWSEYFDTPFWLYIVLKEASGKWITTEEFKRKCEKVSLLLNIHLVIIKNNIYFSLKSKINETEDLVINDLVNQIELIYGELSD